MKLGYVLLRVFWLKGTVGSGFIGGYWLKATVGLCFTEVQLIESYSFQGYLYTSTTANHGKQVWTNETKFANNKKALRWACFIELCSATAGADGPLVWENYHGCPALVTTYKEKERKKEQFLLQILFFSFYSDEIQYWRKGSSFFSTAFSKYV